MKKNLTSIIINSFAVGEISFFSLDAFNDIAYRTFDASLTEKQIMEASAVMILGYLIKPGYEKIRDNIKTYDFKKYL